MVFRKSETVMRKLYDMNDYNLLASNVSGWAGSHHHQHDEHCVVVQGYILMATYKNKKVKIDRLQKDEEMTIPAGVAHNLYLPVGSQILLSKNTDWLPSPDLALILKMLALNKEI